MFYKYLVKCFLNSSLTIKDANITHISYALSRYQKINPILPITSDRIMCNKPKKNLHDTYEYGDIGKYNPYCIPNHESTDRGYSLIIDGSTLET